MCADAGHHGKARKHIDQREDMHQARQREHRLVVRRDVAGKAKPAKLRHLVIHERSQTGHVAPGKDKQQQTKRQLEQDRRVADQPFVLAMTHANGKADDKDELPGERVEEPAAATGVVRDGQSGGSCIKPERPRNGQGRARRVKHSGDQRRACQQQDGIGRQNIHIADLVSQRDQPRHRGTGLVIQKGEVVHHAKFRAHKRICRPGIKTDGRDRQHDMHDIKLPRPSPQRGHRIPKTQLARHPAANGRGIGDARRDARHDKERLCRVGEPDIADGQMLPRVAGHVVDDDHDQRQPAKRIDARIAGAARQVDPAPDGNKLRVRPVGRLCHATILLGRHPISGCRDMLQ